MLDYYKKTKTLFKSVAWIAYSNFVVRRNIRFLNQINQSKEDKTNPIKNLILPILETNHYQIFHLLILAKVMELRGYKITVIACDEALTGCEIKSSTSFDSRLTCLRCTTNRKTLLPLFKFEIKLISQIIKYDEIVFSEEDEIFVADSVSRYFYGGHKEAPTRRSKRVTNSHRLTAGISRSIGRYINRTYENGIILNNMNVYSLWGPLFREIDSNRFVTSILSYSAFDVNTVRFNIVDLFRSRERFSIFRSNRISEKLSEAEGKALDEFLKKRRNGKDTLFSEWKLYSHEQSILFDKSVRNIVLFPNIPWDVGLNEFTGIYDNVFEWLEDTIDFCGVDESVVVWIKIHPGEVKGTSPSKVSVYDWLSRCVLPSNVRVIPPGLSVSPYQLFKDMDLGVVFSGTLGLEMLNAGVPVVSTGIPPYKDLEFGLQPQNRSEYRDMIFNGKFHASEVPAIRLFSYFYFIFLSKRWPFTTRAFGQRFDGYSFQDFDSFLASNREDVDRLCQLVESGGVDH